MPKSDIGFVKNYLETVYCRTEWQNYFVDDPHNRHTFATRLFERNVPAKTISQLLGHTSVSFTLDTYTHVLPNTKKQAIEVLESKGCRMGSY